MMSALRIKCCMRNFFRQKSSLSNLNSSTLSKLVDIHPRVKEALLSSTSSATLTSSGLLSNLKKPVVALESTIITHGMPRPQNLETALLVESIVSEEGSIPATIAIIDGRIKVGLTEDELKYLANLPPEKVIKCSRRDFPYVLSKKLSGGTTVAGTLIIANMVGIKVFATGGIGGVHREGHITMDISADLIELGRTPVTVVSSGVKSILDIPRTLEYLETQGVCVTSFNNPSGDFPAFYTRSSGTKAPYNLKDSREAAALVNSNLKLGLQSGILIGVPIPQEYAMPENLINDAIENALSEVKIKGIKGKKVTPFILEAVSRITAGKSLDSNIALIKNNARIASKIAVELQKIQESEKENTSGLRMDQDANSKVPVVIGATILDLNLTVKEGDLKLDGATYPVVSKTTGGGVGRNIAEGLSKLYGNFHFISVTGDDEIGRNLRLQLGQMCNTQGIESDERYSTAVCSVVFDKLGDCKLILGDMAIHKLITPDIIIKNESFFAKCPLIVMDANISLDTMGTILELSHKYNKPVFYEPTDMRVAGKPFTLPRKLTRQIRFISPNILELNAIANNLIGVGNNIDFNEKLVNFDENNHDKETMVNLAKILLQTVNNHIDCIILTLGKYGVIISNHLQNSNEELFNNTTIKYTANISEGKSKAEKYLRFYATKEAKEIVNVSGAGDSFTSGFITAMLNGYAEENCVHFGFHAAKCALLSTSAVPSRYFEKVEDKIECLKEKAESVAI